MFQLILFTGTIGLVELMNQELARVAKEDPIPLMAVLIIFGLLGFLGYISEGHKAK